MTALYHFQEGWVCYLLCLNMGSSLLEVLQWTPSGLLFSCTLTALWHCSLLPFYFSFMFIGLSGLNCKHFLKYIWRIFCRSSVFIPPFLAVTNLNWKKKKDFRFSSPNPNKMKKNSALKASLPGEHLHTNYHLANLQMRFESRFQMQAPASLCLILAH